MAQYADLKAAINAAIKQNNNQEITGLILNNVLNAMVNSLGANYQFAGVATPSTNPGTPDQNVFYLAGQPGIYSNFNNITIEEGLYVFKWNGSVWTSSIVLEGGSGDGAFDVSAKYPTSGVDGGNTYTLQGALAVLSANLSASKKKGGMSIKFIQSSDNKYVQYRLTSDTFNTTVANWQGISEVPNAFNKDAVEGAYIADRLIYFQNIFAEYIDLELESITGAFLSNTKKVTGGSGYTCKYAYVNAGTIISFKTRSGQAYGGVGIFKQQPAINFYADYIINESSGYFIAPYNCYVLVSDETIKIDTQYIKNAIDYSGKITEEIDNINNRVDDINEDLTNINNKISEYTADGVTEINGYISTSGKHTGYNTTSWKTKYVYVKKGTPIYSNGSVSGNYRAGYCNNQPTNRFTLNTIIPTDITFPYTATQDGYFCISRDISSAALILEAKTQVVDLAALKESVEEIDNNVEEVRVDTYSSNTEALTPIAVYPDVYINNKGRWITSSPGQVTKVYQIAPSKIYYLDIKSINTLHSLVSWSENEPVQGTTLTNHIPYTANINRYQVSPSGMNYMIITGGVNGTDYSTVMAYDTAKINQLLPNIIINGMDRSRRFVNSKRIALYIGDSISTMGNWKNVLKNKYGLDYENNKPEMPASVGGTVLIPKQNEVEQHESIWWRCAEHRLLNAGYSPGIISIFGGTNDMTSSSMNIGTPQDIPFVDNSEDFSVETFDASQEWPQTISFCSALKGCILMIKRDYPNAIIVVPTVFYCSSTYGNWTPTGQSLIASEVISKMQVAVAQSMNAIFIPWYWSERRASTIDIFTVDGVHPSEACANIMARWFANYLPL